MYRLLNHVLGRMPCHQLVAPRIAISVTHCLQCGSWKRGGRQCMSKPHSVHGRAQNALAAGHITVFTANCRSAVDRQLRVFSSRSGTLCLIARGLSLSNFTAVQARQIRRSGPTHCARTLRPIYKSWFHKINPARARRLRGCFRARKGTSAIAAYVSMPSDSGACSKFIPNQVILKIWIGHLHRHRRCCGALCGDER